MAVIHYEQDTSLEPIRARKVAVLGYGSQGHAHALNLKDSGVDVRVGLHEGSRSRVKAGAAGLPVRTVAEACREADVIMVLVPDQVQAYLYAQDIQPHLAPGKALLFAHGFNVHFGQISPPAGVDVLLVAPKSPGHLVRRLYQEGKGTPALLAVHRDATGTAHALGLSYARAIGCARAGVLETTFREETETDLFGEQAVLCGGVTALVQAGFETLVQAGYQPESAYFECLHELKLIVDLMYEGGLGWMRHSISDTAEYGDYTRGPRIVGPAARAEMRKVLADIQSGAFAREWLAEARGGQVEFERLRAEGRAHPIEEVGQRLRRMMGWARDGAAGRAAPADPRAA